MGAGAVNPSWEAGEGQLAHVHQSYSVIFDFPQCAFNHTGAFKNFHELSLSRIRSSELSVFNGLRALSEKIKICSRQVWPIEAMRPRAAESAGLAAGEFGEKPFGAGPSLEPRVTLHSLQKKQNTGRHICQENFDVSEMRDARNATVREFCCPSMRLLGHFAPQCSEKLFAVAVHDIPNLLKREART